MARRLNPQSESVYGFPQPTPNLFPVPISSVRDPSTLDVGYIIGQVWINKSSGTAFVLVSNAGGVATWLSIGGSLTPSVASITTGPAATQTTLAGDTWSAVGTDASITMTITPKGAGGLTLTSGDLTATAGDIIATLGNFEATNGNLLLDTAGNGIEIKEGADGRMGQATFAAGVGVIAVAVASSTANTRAFCQLVAPGLVPPNTDVGFIQADTSVPGTVTFTSVDATGATLTTDNSTFNYLLVEAL